MRLSEMSVFLAVAEHRSFQRAASERGVTRSAISHAILALERDLGARLLNRSTRGVSLTEAGIMLRARLAPAFGEIAQAVDAVTDFGADPQGSVRLTVPRAVAGLVLRPLMEALATHHPRIRLDVSADDRLVDLAADRFDAGIRFGESLKAGTIAVKLPHSLAFAVVGSPAYFADRAIPGAPGDLHAHRCVRYRFPSGARFPWEFERDGQVVRVEVAGPVGSDDQDMMIEAALAGAGLAFVFEHRVAEHLAAGRLVRCLDEWCPPFRDLFLYYAVRDHMPAALRVVVDRLKAS